MLDPKLLRTDFDAVAKQLSKRGLNLDKQRFTLLEEQRKKLQVQTEELQGQRNANSKLIGQAKAKGDDVSEIMATMEKVNQALKANENSLQVLQTELQTWMLELPNLPHEDVPAGKSEEDNIEVRAWGTVPSFDFQPQDHVDVGEKLGGLDFDTAAKITGSRFVTMQGAMAQLHRALIQFMLDTHVKEHGYQEVYVPFIVNSESLRGTGQLPKFEEDLFKLNSQENKSDSSYYLIPTAEVPVTNIWRDRNCQLSMYAIRRVFVLKQVLMVKIQEV